MKNVNQIHNELLHQYIVKNEIKILKEIITSIDYFPSMCATLSR